MATAKKAASTGAAVLEDTEATEVVETAAAAPPVKESVQQKKNRLRNEAEREVLNNHRDEFYKIAEKKFADEGLEFTRRMTDEEKAEKKLQDLMNQFPQLRNKVEAEALAKQAGVEVPDEG